MFNKENSELKYKRVFFFLTCSGRLLIFPFNYKALECEK